VIVGAPTSVEWLSTPLRSSITGPLVGDGLEFWIVTAYEISPPERTTPPTTLLTGTATLSITRCSSSNTDTVPFAPLVEAPHPRQQRQSGRAL
jgi:hypothetical protein